MLTGPTLRERSLVDGCAKPHTITILRPDDTPANRQSLLASEKVWRAQMLAQPLSQLRRAKLAVDTAFSTAQALGFRRDAHYILAAQDETGALRGLITFLHWTSRQEWEIALLTVSPADQGGSEAPCRLRGVGSELTGAAAQIMSTKACQRTVLSPLDEAARAFYVRRGFTCPTPVTDPTTKHVKLDDCVLSCPGLTALAATYAHSPTDDEDMVVGAPPASVSVQSWEARFAAAPTRGSVFIQADPLWNGERDPNHGAYRSVDGLIRAMRQGRLTVGQYQDALLDMQARRWITAGDRSGQQDLRKAWSAAAAYYRY